MLSIIERGLLNLTYKNNNNGNAAIDILFYNIMVTCTCDLGQQLITFIVWFLGVIK